MTLTELNYNVRRLAPVAVIFILVILIFAFGIRLIYLYVNQNNPDIQQTQQQVPTDPIFNEIQPPKLPSVKTSNGISFLLDTLDGTTNFEGATPAAQVYFLPKDTPSFGYLSKIYSIAEQFGIDTTVTKEQIRDQIAQFEDGLRTLEIDIADYNFKYTFAISRQEDYIDTEPTAEISTDRVVGAASEVIREVRYPEELAQGRTNVLFYLYDTGRNELRNVETIEEANVYEVNFFRSDVSIYPVITSSYYSSPNYVLLGYKDGEYLPIQAQIKFYEKSQDQIGVYPLRTPDEAFADLQKGEGFVVSNPNSLTNVRVQKIFMGYYDPEEYQEYLQPMYVFLGQDQFVAYVPAVDEEYLTE